MPFLSIVPDMLSAAADNLQSIGSRMSADNSAALGPAISLIPAASDQVSPSAATQFVAHAQIYEAASAHAAAIHQMFVTALAVSAGSYAATEAANSVATS